MSGVCAPHAHVSLDARAQLESGSSPLPPSAGRRLSPPKPQSSHLDIAPVASTADLKAFVDFPWHIYRDHKNWAPPLKADVRHLLDMARHPFWKFSQRELFLARRDGEVVGRIAAIIDGNHNHRFDERAGVFGFFECRDDRNVAAGLFAAAENWLRQRDITQVRGPYNPSLNYEVGLLIDGHQYPSTLMMPYQPKYYLPLIEEAGYEKEKDLLAFLLTPADPPTPRFEKIAARVRRRGGYHVRSADMRRKDEEIELIKHLYHSCWDDSWGFVPMSDGEFDEMGRTLIPIVDPELLLFFYHHDEPVGICMVVPDMNPMLRRLNGKVGLRGMLKYLWYRREVCGLRGLIIGFKPEHVNKGLPLLAFDHLNRILRTSPKCAYLELGWNLEDNNAINNFDAEMGAKQHKRIRLFRKQL